MFLAKKWQTDVLIKSGVAAEEIDGHNAAEEKIVYHIKNIGT